MNKKTANSIIIKTMGFPMNKKAQGIQDDLINHLTTNAKELGNYDSVENYLDSVRNDVVNDVPKKLLSLYENTVKNIDYNMQRSLFESKTEVISKAAVALMAINKLAPGVKNIASFSDIKYAIENGV